MQSETSVYDLKDHPDFQYRPGTVVIRVANFQGEDEVCTAGQVLDNYPEGLVSQVVFKLLKSFLSLQINLKIVYLVWFSNVN